MPVDFSPLIFSMLLIGVPLVFYTRYRASAVAAKEQDVRMRYKRKDVIFPSTIASNQAGRENQKRRRTHFLYASAISVSLISILLLIVYIPGWYWRFKASRGDPAATYQLARWTEYHNEQIARFIVWPFGPEVLEGYAWLDKAASLDYPPAVYALGFRLKYGIGVPKPDNWMGTSGNVFEQPERGQKLIEKAINLGYRLEGREEEFYFRVYR
jgi:hypothetical protein